MKSASPQRMRVFSPFSVDTVTCRVPLRWNVVGQVSLIVAPQHRRSRGQLLDELVHHPNLGLPIRSGGVDDVEQQIGVFQLLQRGPESLHQMVGQLGDKAHGVGQNGVGPLPDPKGPGGGVQRVEQTVIGGNSRAGEPV